MITLVSYPRSGNTFLRNVLFEVYGIQSATYHLEAHGPDIDWESYPVVKTHLLLEQLPESLRKRHIVYLIRDGRDACVSLAHHKQDVFDPESNFLENLNEIIYASEGSHFNGWGEHVMQWYQHSDLVIRFEDLIEDPLDICRQLDAFLSLPEPAVERLPDFKTLKKGRPEYGSGKYLEGENLASVWFRKGKVGAYREEMPTSYQNVFWHLHGEAMTFIGYSETCMDWPKAQEPMSILIEASKLDDSKMDGIKRYVLDLIKAVRRYTPDWIIVKVLINGQIFSLDEAIERGQSESVLPSSGGVEILKETLRAILPSAAYQSLAKRVPISDIKQWVVKLKHKGKQQGNVGEPTVYDAVLLTLPQHFKFIECFQFNKLVGVVHDLTHRNMKEYHDENNVVLAEKGMQFLHDEKASLIAVSRATSSQLDKISLPSTVVYEGVDRRRFFPIQNAHLKALVRERYGLPHSSFILSVSTLEPRKNIARLIEAYAQLEESVRQENHLVLAGKKGWKWKDIAIPLDCKAQVHFTGYVAEEHLAALYTMAKGFAYISLEEGFGLPVLEAMACSTPVMVSNRSSLPEVAGTAAFYCEPENVESIREALETLMASPDLTERGNSLMKRSWEFNWLKNWNETLKILHSQTTE